MKLALGTVQFGLDYGSFGAQRQVETAEVQSILDRAKRAGIDLLDTARAYGQSEEALGRVHAADDFRIVTKCPSLASERDPVAALHGHFERSCKALGVDHVAGYLLHDAGDVERAGVWTALEALVAAGRAGRIGVSSYGYEETAELCRRYPITLVQLPANVLTPWYIDHPLPEAVEVHIRSVFLQGFLLSDPDQLPARFQPWRSTLQLFRERAEALGLTPQAAALAPLLQSANVDRIVVGVETGAQLDQILDAVSVIDGAGPIDLGAYPDVTPALTDPRNWQG